MAMTFHSVERLGRPFAGVSEIALVIPHGGEVVVPIPEVKILFFLQADCVQEIREVGVFKMRAGDILIVPRSCRQSYRLEKPGDSSRIHVLKLSFDLPLLPPPGHSHDRRRAIRDPETDLPSFVRHHFTEIRHLPEAQDALMKEIMLAIRQEAEEHRPGIRHRVRSLCTSLVVHVARRLHDVPATSSTTQAGAGFVVTQAKEFLLRNFSRPLTLGEIAWHVKISEEHLARVFRRVTGATVFDYLRTVRLESAKTLLLDSNQTLTEIATHTGFGSLSLFSRNFSQYVGQTPSSYRQDRAQRIHWPNEERPAPKAR